MEPTEPIIDYAVIDVDHYTIGAPGLAASAVAPGKPAEPAGWPDTALDAAQVGGLDVRAASVRGLMHRYDGTPRQDSYALAWQKDLAALVVTVCDGIGSRAHSHEAAELVAQQTASALTRDSDSGELRWLQAFGAALPEIGRRISGGKQMATTVISAYITAIADNTYRAEVAWIGDSAAYLLTGHTWQAVGGSVKTVDSDGGPLTTATRAVPSVVLEVHTNTIEFGSTEALFLMTDGVADPLGEGSGEVGGALASWWASPPDKFNFAAQVDFARRSFDDDRTVVGVWPTRRGGDL